METKQFNKAQRCRLILKQCLAIQLTKPGHTPEDFWMYDSGYMIFQNFLAANAQCWWNPPLTAATRALKYAGHVAPGMLLVTAEPCALEVLRGAYARSVLKPPATYVISSVGDIDDCIITPTVQGQFTPLPEALCDIIMDLTSQGQTATIENIKSILTFRFPNMQIPPTEMIYDTLVQLMQEQKIYQTAKGFFIVTPERRRSRSRPRSQRSLNTSYDEMEFAESRSLLMTNSEAVHSLYGEISTERDGDLTHQCIQTNLADVIRGGNPNDKIIYARSSKRRSSSFPTPRSLERRNSLRIFGSSRKLQRFASTRSLYKNFVQPITDGSNNSEQKIPESTAIKKPSLLSRLFRRSGRSRQRQIQSYSGQFPPTEWFNSKIVHLHSVGTQTMELEGTGSQSLANSALYGSSVIHQRSSTLPRRQRHRSLMSSDSTFPISSRDCSPIRRYSPAYSTVSLPRSTLSIQTAGSQKTRPPLPMKQQHLRDQNGLSSIKSVQNNQAYRNEQMVPTVNNSSNKISVQSGPSSLESTKTSSNATSGPSSLDDSGKFAASRYSGHSSLESTSTSTSTATTLQKQPATRNSFTNHSDERFKKLNGNNAKHKSLNKVNDHIENYRCNKSVVDNTNSNSLITLQVTTNNMQHNNLPSTKIYVENSPVRSVITLDNGKPIDNSNVFIINNETTTNEKGELIKRTISRHGNKAKVKQNQLSRKENSYDLSSDTYDSLSLVSDLSPDQNPPIVHNAIFVNDDIECTKFHKNINNDTPMNNSRKLSLPVTQSPNNKKCNNVLKNLPESNLPSPVIDKNLFGTDQHKPDPLEYQTGSVDNIRCLSKTDIKLNSNNDMNYLHYLDVDDPCMKDSLLQSNPNVNSDSLAHMLKKNLTTVGSEPNLAPNQMEKSIVKEAVERRLSTNEELLNFPSLTDLSFNFTSLAAKQILQGVSINSLDTLMELNMTTEKQQNNTIQPVYPDLGVL